MRTRTAHTDRHQRRATNLAEAQAAYQKKRETIAARMTTIQKLIANHGPTDADQLFWGYVGDLKHVDGLLKQIEQFLLNNPDEN